MSVFFELISEPVVDRNPEPHFFTEHDLIRNDTAESFLEDIFLVVPSFEFEIVGNLCSQLEELMIEEW